MRPALATLVALLALGGCDPERVEETEIEKVRFELGPERPRIEVEIDEGSIENRRRREHPGDRG